jgi:hypothetical protein
MNQVNEHEQCGTVVDFLPTPLQQFEKKYTSCYLCAFFQFLIFRPKYCQLRFAEVRDFAGPKEFRPDLTPTGSSTGSNTQHFCYSRFHSQGNPRVLREFQCFFADFLRKRVHRGGHPRAATHQQFVQENPHRPDISFQSVLLSLQNLRSHVCRTSNERTSSFSLGQETAKSPICYFNVTALEENVSRFDISVNNSLLLRLHHR